ncbi:MAG TPA: ATP-binding protein [Dehalococcoidia bacterium]|nr:ATP-binding protein [Dehalococcoidia bacterium]
MPRGRLALRVTLPITTGLAAAIGAVLAYAITGGWPYAIAGAAVGAWATALLAAETITSAFAQASQRLRNIARGAEDDAGAGPRLLESAELHDAIEELAQALATRADAASRDRARLVAALNSSGDAIVAVDGEGKVAFANIAAERLLVRPHGDLLGRPFAWLMPNADILEAMRLSSEAGRRETRTIERPNKEFLEVSVNPVVGGDWAAFLVFHDLTEVRRADQMRRDFVANVSHELRTPLASIRAVLDTLEAGAMADPVAGREFISRAQAEVERLTAMVGELLELSRIESGDLGSKPVPTDMARVVGAAVTRMQPQAERLGVRLGLALPQSMPAVLGDAERLERAVVNLVHNALKFTPRGGNVVVSARTAGDVVTVEVQDDGAGIDARDLPRIFERFYKSDRSRRTEGSGLGLALVKRTVEAHGGRVEAVSELGRGSTFRLTLPVLGSGAAGEAAEAPARRRAQ